tara:strand:+ start:587 stop:1849 length:1263 start_codon:yes stop_codon:yes gene_type:complete
VDRKKRTVDTNTSIPLSNVVRKSEISSYVKQLINASQYDFYESEAFEVSKVILNDSINHGGVLGAFINNPTQEIKGGIVLPLMPHVTNIPVFGEHVVVVEYNGQHYYTSIINRYNSANENSMPGVAVPYGENAKYGETFKRQDIRRVKVSEGEIVFEGRFGNTIKLGCNHKNNTPNIRIRAGQQKPPEEIGAVVAENINEDKSSIYLSTDETIELDEIKTSGNKSFPPESIKGNSIVMNSDKIFLNSKSGNLNVRASKDLILQGNEVFIHAKSGQTIKMGDPRATFIPTLNGEVVNDLMKDIMFTLKEGFGALSKATNVATILSAVKDIAKIVADRVPNIVDIVANEKYLNKQIMVANPNLKIPEFAKGKKKKKTLQSSAEDNSAGVNSRTADGKFDSDNIERPSKRDSSGNRDVGPRRY